MAIAKLPTNNKPSPIPTGDEGIKHNTQVNDVPETTTPWVDTASVSKSVERYVPVEGLPCVGTYYQQLRQADDYSDVLDDLISASYQQYSRINEYQLMLDSEFNTTTNEETKVTTVSVEATIADTIIPNRGDLFITDIGSGRIGLLAVSSTNRLTIYNNTAYKVTLVLHKIMDESSHTLLEDLNSKVVMDYHYNKQYLELGKSPLLTTDELEKFKDRAVTAQLLSTQYLREFHHPVLRSVALEVEDTLIYDYFVTDFVIRTFRDLPNDIKQYRPDDYPENTVYTLIANRHNGSFKSTVTKEVSYIAKIQGMDLCYRYGLMHTPVTHIALAKNDKIYLGMNSAYTPNAFKLSGIINASSIDTPTPLETGTLRPFPDVYGNETYIFSDSWYRDDATTSLLEYMLDDWFKRRPADPRKLATIIDATNHMTVVERFYLLPIIIFLLTYSK